MIHHVALESAAADREALVAFFGLLGFTPVAVPPGLVERALWVEREGTQVHVLFADAPVVPSIGHVAVVCPDYADALRRLERAGYAPERRTEHWGSPRCSVTAPGGHRVEIMAFRPGPPYALANS